MTVAPVRRYVWDIETDGLGSPGHKPRELLAVVRWGPLPGDVKAFWGRGSALRCVRWAIGHAGNGGERAELWAHYGGGFDARFVIPGLCAEVDKGGCERAQALDVGSTVLRFWGVLDGVRFDLRDSIRLLPGSLARIGEELGERKLPQSFVHRRGRCRCTMCLYKRDRPALLKYCVQDTKVLWSALEWAERLLATIGVDRLRLTLASCAAASVLGPLAKEDRPYTPHGEEKREEPWDALLSGEEPTTSDVDVDRDAEQAACGGRTEGFLRSLLAGNLFDRRASYPAAMAEGLLPWRYAGPGKRQWEPDPEGRIRSIVWATVEVPPTEFPVLPWRDPKGKLLFPTGVWRGAFCDEELAYAVQGGRARVTRVWRVERWHTSSRLAEWALDLWERIHDAVGFERYFWKILRNSAYGGFLMRREQRTYILRPKSAVGLSRVLDRIPLFFKETSYQPARRNVVTGAFITARARIALHRAILAAENAGGQVCYCDTDSVLTSGELPEGMIGPELGAWDLQARVRDVTILAPKLYRYRDENGPVVKAKGMRHVTWDEFDALERGESVKVARGRGWRESIRKGSIDYDRVDAERRWLLGARPKRAPLPGGGSRPWLVEGDSYAEEWTP